MKHTTNIYINCPYSEKDECKELGARWDRENRQWYIPAGLDTEPFQKWIDASSIIEKISHFGSKLKSFLHEVRSNS